MHALTPSRVRSGLAFGISQAVASVSPGAGLPALAIGFAYALVRSLGDRDGGLLVRLIWSATHRATTDAGWRSSLRTAGARLAIGRTVGLAFLLLALVACDSVPTEARTTAASPTSTVAVAAASQIATPTASAPSAQPNPAANPQNAPPPPGQAGGASSSYTITAAYTQTGGDVAKSSQTYSAANADQSAVYVAGSGDLTLSNATITTTGNTSSADNSFHGLNAALLAAGGSTITLSDSSVTTSGTGANGAFATDAGSSVVLSRVTINATGDGGHGVMATNGGSLTLVDVALTTGGKNSGAIATDRGGGTIDVTGGAVTTSGQDSPAIYSTGAISVSGGKLTATGAEAAVIEGRNSITLSNSALSSSKEKWGVMIYQSMSGDAQGTKGTFTMTGGSLGYTPANGPLFYVTNSTGVITLKGVQIASGSATLIKASAGAWGQQGSNGGTVVFTADGQTLKGNLVADSISSIALTLQNGSTLEGSVDAGNTAKSVSLSLGASSTWNVTADSYLTSLNDTAGLSGASITNITGNGHTVYYDSSASAALGGKTYSLSGGGSLKPAS